MLNSNDQNIYSCVGLSLFGIFNFGITEIPSGHFVVYSLAGINNDLTRLLSHRHRAYTLLICNMNIKGLFTWRWGTPER